MYVSIGINTNAFSNSRNVAHSGMGYLDIGFICTALQLDMKPA